VPRSDIELVIVLLSVFFDGFLDGKAFYAPHAQKNGPDGNAERF
jgi:hypothetical protein